MNEIIKTPDGPPAATDLAGAMTLSAWMQQVGISRTTAWLWRRTGKLKVIHRYGRAYVTAEEIQKHIQGGGLGRKKFTTQKSLTAELEH
jgi:hypothetical protein